MQGGACQEEKLACVCLNQGRILGPCRNSEHSAIYNFTRSLQRYWRTGLCIGSSSTPERRVSPYQIGYGFFAIAARTCSSGKRSTIHILRRLGFMAKLIHVVIAAKLNNSISITGKEMRR